MTTATATANVPTFSEREQRDIARILDRMDRVSNRTEQHYSRMRKHDRKPYRGPLSVFLPTEFHMSPPANGDERCLPAWSYSLSQGGVGMIMLEELTWNELWIGVHLPNHSLRWMYGRIVRRRQVPEEAFFDYGISFMPHTDVGGTTS